jgi:hypothetical protein
MKILAAVALFLGTAFLPPPFYIFTGIACCIWFGWELAMLRCSRRTQ